MVKGQIIQIIRKKKKIQIKKKKKKNNQVINTNPLFVAEKQRISVSKRSET